ncbi:MAG: excinuclease ABC subunit UvrC [Simkaniaceae bacterium]|nr:excinuclease ABC subunit UvrC [Candidatus Sacchlamyda saccharinae]
MPFDPDQLDRFPVDPGVYLMKNARGQVIYVGKAKHLKKRVKQYFAPGRDTRAMIPYLLKEIHSIETIVVETEKEALLVENTLIKKHKPRYNATLKDDKTFISLMINHHHKWPRLQLIRYKGKPKLKGLYFGPYTSAYAARQTYELLTKLFPLRQCSDEELKRRTRPCILYGIKRCIAPCVDLCTKQEYDTFVDGTIDFLKGKDTEVLDQLREEMLEASDNLEFEKAGALHNTIQQIEHVIQTRQVVQKAGTKDSDSIGLFRQADEVVLMQLFVREGKLVGSEHYSFSHALEEDEELIASFLLQYYQKKKDLPKEILLPIKLKDHSALTEILNIPLLTPERGSKKSLVRLAQKNAGTTFRQEKNEQELREKMLLDLSEKLNLNRYPQRIECFDTSNISGTDLVASMVAFTNGTYDKKRTRYYKIKGIDKSDDYGAMHQVLSRRLSKAKDEDDLPDLILIDGGKGQLNIGLQVLKELDIASVDIAAITKEEAKHTKGMTAERIFIPDHKEPIHLDVRSPLLFLLQQIRDAAHDRAIGFHRKRRSKRVISSALETVPGIGPIKKKRLLQKFGSFKRIQDATDEELLSVAGITKKDITTLRNYLK